MLDLGRRKVGIKLSASLDLGTTSSSSCRLENKKSEADEDSSNKGETDLVPRFSGTYFLQLGLSDTRSKHGRR